MSSFIDLILSGNHGRRAFFNTQAQLNVLQQEQQESSVWFGFYLPNRKRTTVKLAHNDAGSFVPMVYRRSSVFRVVLLVGAEM